MQEQLRDKDKQLCSLKDRVKSLQTDSSNTDTALATLEEALSEKVLPTPAALRAPEDALLNLQYSSIRTGVVLNMSELPNVFSKALNLKLTQARLVTLVLICIW